MLYVVGAADENEILLYNTVLALRDSLHLLFKSVLPPLPRPLRHGSGCSGPENLLFANHIPMKAIRGQENHYRKLRPCLTRN